MFLSPLCFSRAGRFFLKSPVVIFFLAVSLVLGPVLPSFTYPTVHAEGTVEELEAALATVQQELTEAQTTLQQFEESITAAQNRDLRLTFEGFGEGAHSGRFITAVLHSALPNTFRFYGDGGTLVSQGTIGSLVAGEEGRGDWALQWDGKLQVKEIVIQHVRGRTNGKLHLDTNGVDVWIPMGQGGAFPADHVLEGFSISAGAGFGEYRLASIVIEKPLQAGESTLEELLAQKETQQAVVAAKEAAITAAQEALDLARAEAESPAEVEETPAPPSDAEPADDSPSSEFVAALEALRVNVQAAEIAETAMTIQTLDSFVFSKTLAEHVWQNLNLPEGFTAQAASVSPDNRFLVVGGENGHVLMYAAGTGELLADIATYSTPIKHIAFLSDTTILIGLDTSVEVVDFAGSVIKKLPFDSQVEGVQILPDKSFFVVVSSSATARHRGLHYRADGSLVNTFIIGNDWQQLTLSDDGGSVTFSDGTWVNGFHPATNNLHFSLNFSDYLGSNVHPSVSKVAIEGNSSAGHFFLGVKTDTRPRLAVVDAGGNFLWQDFPLAEGKTLAFLKSLGNDTIAVGVGNQVKFFKLQHNQLAELQTLTLPSGMAKSADVSADRSTIIVVRSDGVSAFAVPEGVAATSLLQTVASKLSLINFSTFPDDQAGRDFIASHRAQHHDIIAKANPDMHLTYSTEEVFAEFIERNPQWTEEAISARIPQYSKAWYDELYVRNTEYAQYEQALGSYNDAVSKMVEAAFNVVITEANLGNAEPYLNELRSAPNSPMYGNTLNILGNIGIEVPTDNEVIQAVQHAMLTKGDDLIFWQTDINQDAQKVIQNFANPDPDYAGDGERTSLTSTEMLELARKQVIGEAQSQLVMYAADGLTPIGVGGKTFEQMATESSTTGTPLHTQIIASLVKLDTKTSKDLLQEKIMKSRDERIRKRMLAWYEKQAATENQQSISEEEKMDLGAKAKLLTLNDRVVSDAEIGEFFSTLKSAADIDISDPLPSFLSVDAASQKLHFNPDISDIHFVPQFLKDTLSLVSPYPAESFPRDLLIKPAATATATIQITENSMVNLWVEGGSSRNLDLSLNVDGLAKTSLHAMGMGDSLSYRLVPGTYTLTVKDETNYPHQETTSFLAPLHINIQTFSPTNILGEVSGESPEVLPISLISFGGKAIDLNNPVWVVTHGRGDTMNSDKIRELAQSLDQKGYQVALLDWRGAAGDNAWQRLGLDGANWIEPVGAWATDQLQSLGFSGSKVFLAGHSWGTFVEYEIAKGYKDNRPGHPGNGFGVQGLVALDSALNPLPVNKYDDTRVNFGSVSKLSWAFRSSVFGSEGRANTATANFGVMLPNEYQKCKELLLNPYDSMFNNLVSCVISGDPLGETIKIHGYAVTLFAAIVRDNYGDASMANLKIADLMAEKKPPIGLDPAKPDGMIRINLEQVTDSFVHAIPLSLVDFTPL